MVADGGGVPLTKAGKTENAWETVRRIISGPAQYPVTVKLQAPHQLARPSSCGSEEPSRAAPEAVSRLKMILRNITSLTPM